MKSAWNLVGMGLWLLLIVYFAYIIHDMRARRLRLIVTEKKSFTWHNFWISFGELAIFLLFLWGMSYATFFQDVKKMDQNRITTSYSYKPLIIRYRADQSDYVTVSMVTDANRFKITPTMSMAASTWLTAQMRLWCMERVI